MDTTAMGVRTAPVAMGYRVMQLVVGIACMVAIANLQYGWTLFVEMGAVLTVVPIANMIQT